MPRLEPVDYDPFEGARAAFPSFVTGEQAQPVDPSTGLPVLVDPAQAPKWMQALVNPETSVWPVRMAARGLGVVGQAARGDNPFETLVGAPGAAPAGSQDATYTPNLLGRALGMTEPWRAPSSDSGIAKVQDLSGLMATGPLAEARGAATLGSGMTRPGAIEVKPTPLMEKYADAVKALRKYPDWHDTDPEVLVHNTKYMLDNTTEAKQLLQDMKQFDRDTVNNAPSVPFYSAVEQAVRDARQESMTPEQWQGYLRNRPGVKQEELDWVGMPNGKKVSKQEMLDHLQDHGVQIKEVNKQGGTSTISEDEYYGMLDDRTHEAVLADYPRKRGESPEAYDERTEKVREHYQEAVVDELAQEGILHPNDAKVATGGPKFSDYQLPGGENYREQLFTLPEKTEKRISEIDSQIQQLFGRKPRNKAEFASPEDAELFGKLSQEKMELSKQIKQPFISSHWGEPNVLAHARMNERDIPGVGKTLHLEELQSDWHQKGRKEGYSSDFDASHDKLVAAEKSYIAKSQVHGEASNEATQAFLKYQEENQRHLKDFPMGNSRVPDAPFKTTWPDLILKRAIREAAESGHDAISWTPGEAQAARYDLSKHISEVHYNKSREGLTAYDHNKSPVLVKSGVKPEQLADFIGKEAAERLMKSKEEPSKVRGAENDETYRLKGADLKVGGEGMKAFYDKMLVDKANALGKKFGAKVEWKEIPSGEWTAEGAPTKFTSKQQAEDWIKLVQSGKPDFKSKAVEVKGHSVPVLRLTPQLKDAALRKGFPMFSAGLPFPLEPVDHDPFSKEQ